MTILLRDILPISAPETYKIHFARWNRENEPLEVWARDRDEWQMGISRASVYRLSKAGLFC